MPDADISGNGFDPMGADPNLGAGIGNMAEDPNAGMPAEDPMAGEDMNVGSEAEGDDDSTASIIDQLSDDDKEAVRNYAKSLLNRDETTGPEDAGMGMEEPEMAAQSQAQPGVMMEISKGRLKKVQKALQEKFRDNDSDDDETERKQEKVRKNHGKKSPFDSPLD